MLEEACDPVPVTEDPDVLLVPVGVGAAPTVTVADFVTLPPEPLQVRMYVLVEVSGPVLWLPDTGFEPDQTPDAVHVVAFVEDHVRVADALYATDDGVAVRARVGAGAGGGGGGAVPEPSP